MAVLNHFFLGILVLQICVNAAPSDVSKLEEMAKVETANENLDSSPKEDENNTNSTETIRQKRFYNPFSYGYPPISPVIYPSFNRRDDFSGNFGMEDPLAIIYRHVQDIANFVRQPQQPGPLPHVPIFYPILFVPPFDCNCNPNSYQPTDQGIDQPIDHPVDQPLDRPIEQPVDQKIDRPTDQRIDQPVDQPIDQQINQATDPALNPVNTDEQHPIEVPNRFSQVDNDSNNKVGDNGKRTPNKGKPEFSRPISLDPVKINQATERPQPPIEHGTIQSDDAGNQIPQLVENETQPPTPPNSHPTSPPNVRPPSSLYNRPTRPHSTESPISSRFPIESEPPTACETATISCCHQPSLHQCFILQGCPNYSPSACATDTVMRIIKRLETYYANRNKWQNIF